MCAEPYGTGPYTLMPINIGDKELIIKSIESEIHIEIDFDDVPHEEILEEAKDIVDSLNIQWRRRKY